MGQLRFLSSIRLSKAESSLELRSSSSAIILGTYSSDDVLRSMVNPRLNSEDGNPKIEIRIVSPITFFKSPGSGDDRSKNGTIGHKFDPNWVVEVPRQIAHHRVVKKLYLFENHPKILLCKLIKYYTLILELAIRRLR